ncbi:MAG: hypothetical protein QXK90_02680 [Candidatus Parvarchaeota archaeon]|nr:hypothetical protein [Candidatus Parvarchaeota archaeon]
MGKIVLKIKVLPKDVSAKAEDTAEKARDFLSEYGAVYRVEIQPLAFGLNVIFITLVIDESIGSSHVEDSFKNFSDGEMSITDITRMIE